MLVRRAITAWWNRVNVHIEHPVTPRNAYDTRFLLHLSDGRVQDILAVIDVAAGLHPLPQLGVVDQEEPGSGAIDHKSARSHMTRFEMVGCE